MFQFEKKSINWKDPKIQNALNLFLEKKLPVRTIPEFANYINSLCGTNIALSTIRNRVYQEQKERRLVLQGMQQASGTSYSFDNSPSSSLTTSTTALPPPDPINNSNFNNKDNEMILQALQAVPVMLKDDSGELLQAIALFNDIANNSTKNEIKEQTKVTIHNQQQNKKMKDSIILIDGPIDDEEIQVYSSDDDEDDDIIPDPNMPTPLKYTPLPKEFVQHFDSKAFKVDMNSLKQLTIYIREKINYIKKALDIYPNHNSFKNKNIDAFKRNLNVIKQSGEYFNKLLSFEDNIEYFQNILSPITIAINILTSNNTGYIDQFYQCNSNNDNNEYLPCCKLTKIGMNNLIIILNGILYEIESLINDFDLMKFKSIKINKTKMMILTLKFSRFYRLAGKFADSALATSNNEEANKLANELNTIKLIEINPINTIFDNDHAEILPGTSIWL